MLKKFKKFTKFEKTYFFNGEFINGNYKLLKTYDSL